MLGDCAEVGNARFAGWESGAEGDGELEDIFVCVFRGIGFWGVGFWDDALLNEMRQG